jgi:hypothetical protein
VIEYATWRYARRHKASASQIQLERRAAAMSAAISLCAIEIAWGIQDQTGAGIFAIRAVVLKAMPDTFLPAPTTFAVSSNTTPILSGRPRWCSS